MYFLAEEASERTRVSKHASERSECKWKEGACGGSEGLD